MKETEPPLRQMVKPATGIVTIIPTASAFIEAFSQGIQPVTLAKP